MNGENRYLLCRAGRYWIAIGIDRLLRISDGESAASERIDLRALLSGPGAEGGVALTVETSQGLRVLLVDTVAGIANVADEAFVPLPEIFASARNFFDAACRHKIGDAYPLRLHSQPEFASAPL